MQTLSKSATKLTCYHCGDDCLNDNIKQEEKIFCCAGCKTVFEILDANNLCDYYDLEKNPGIRMEKPVAQEKFAFLDNSEIQKQLLRFSDGNTSKIELTLPQIHCSSCIWLLEHLNQLNDSVLQSTVNFPKKEISVTYKEQDFGLRQLVELISSLGYEPEINLSLNKEKTEGKINRSLIYKIGIAGFCFGNIMLLSFPEYLAREASALYDYKQFFGYLNLVLVIPVVFYSASEYFQSAFSGLKNKIINIDVPIALGIITLFLRSGYEILSHTGAGYLDSLAGLVFFLLVGKWYQSKTYRTLSFERDYTSYFPLAVNVLQNEQEHVINVNDLQKGDLIRIRNEEIVPADAVLKSGKASIDYSFVTGESEPVSVDEGELIYAGGRQRGASIELSVEKEVSQSYLTQLWNHKVFGRDFSSITSMVDVAAKYFTVAILFIAIATGLYWYFSSPELVFNTFTAVLIIACPCALALTIPFALGSAIRLFGKAGLYVKNTATIEQMAKVNCIVFDKTGTLTENDHSTVQFKGNELSEEQKTLIKSLANQSSHPLSKVITSHLNSDLLEIRQYKEFSGLGVSAIVKGKEVKLGSAAFMQLNHVEEFGTVVYAEIDGIMLGKFYITKPYRKGIGELLTKLNEDISLHVLSGDNESEKNVLQKMFPAKASMHFNCAPMDKLNYIDKLQKNNNKVLMIGDGLNDAGALKQADIGLAVSENLNHFSPATNAITEGKNLFKLHDYLSFSKSSMTVVKISFVISLLYNVIGLSFAVQGLLSPLIAAILMPLSSVSIVVFVTLATSLLAKNKF
ncbi:MAG: heavy metal translocating P-type ATPase metal-binding domain-containing protein [Bacteroidia bacterium]|nr:heavy metal translocating P-type ATPase metal-binding domain-containing protein [Bacteroidia bacterium]